MTYFSHHTHRKRFTTLFCGRYLHTLYIFFFLAHRQPVSTHEGRSDKGFNRWLHTHIKFLFSWEEQKHFFPSWTTTNQLKFNFYNTCLIDPFWNILQDPPNENLLVRHNQKWPINRRQLPRRVNALKKSCGAIRITCQISSELLTFSFPFGERFICTLSKTLPSLLPWDTGLMRGKCGCAML